MSSPSIPRLAARVRRQAMSLPRDESPTDQMRSIIRSSDPLLSSNEVDEAAGALLNDLTGCGGVLGLFADAEVTDIMINGPGPVWVERHGRIERSGIHVERPVIASLIEHLLTASGRRVDLASPIVDARLADGSRLNVVLPPIAVEGPCITIRRFTHRGRTLRDFASADVVGFLEAAVIDRASIVVSGATGAGKTSLLNALAASIDPHERIVTIEDAAELTFPSPGVVRLETRPANAEGSGSVNIAQLVRNALRMRPDRIIVGECRGAEAFDMVQAMHTGHPGSLTTVHANDADDALRRLETMVASASSGLSAPTIRSQLTSAIDFVVHVDRSPDGSRRVSSIVKVTSPVDSSMPTVVVADSAGIR